MTDIKKIEEQKIYYTPSVKLAIMVHRAKNLDKYNDYHRSNYHSKKQDPEWNEKFLARCKENNRKYREKKRLENPPLRTVGRPRKIPIMDI